MKNHYGSIDAPGSMHGNNCNPYIADLNALPVIRDKTRLVIGDALRTCPYNWNQMTKENKIAVSLDPIAHDVFARYVLAERRKADGRQVGHITGKSRYLETAVELGLGADKDHIEWRTLALG
jgi:hypothetical protein